MTLKELKKLRKNDIIEVIWLDATADSRWLLEENIVKKPLEKCKTVGYFFDADRTALKLSMSVATTDGQRDVMIIPTNCIVTIKIFGDNGWQLLQ